MPKVKGSTVLPRLEYIKQKGGDLEKVLALVNPGFSREVKKGILLNTWYDFDGYLELSGAADRVMGKGDLAMVWDMGRFSAEYAFKGIYKMFYKIGTPEWVMKMGMSVWKQYYDTGKAHDPSYGKICHPNCDCGRFVEIWNNVFLEFYREEDGGPLKPLPSKKLLCLTEFGSRPRRKCDDPRSQIRG